MSGHAFYLEPEAWSDCPELAGQEARHANVLRLKAGDRISLLNGLGKTAQCLITHMNKNNVQLRILALTETPAPKAQPIVALALSKATRRGFFLEKASELGAAEIWLWQADFSQGKLSESLAANCQGQLVAGCKQCGNPWLPLVRAMPDIRAVAEAGAGANWRILPWEAQTGIPMLLPDMLGRIGRTVYVIGPEGGFSEGELECLKSAGFNAVSLGGRVLRCETAATLCLGLHWWAAQLPGHPDFAG